MTKVYLLSLCVLFVAVIYYSVGRSVSLPWIKKVTIMLSGALFGIAGLFIMYFIENGNFEGLSFFGAFFFGPLGILASCHLLKLTKENSAYMMDIGVPSVCAALCIHKIGCALTGCCYGKLIKVFEDGTGLRFPSQLVESGTALLTMILFLWFIRKGYFHGQLYPIYMIVYGMERFCLNFFRDTQGHSGLPMGQLWSIVAILLGASHFYLRYLLKTAEKEKKHIKRNRTIHKPNH